MFREILSQDDTVLFIGSGISRWSGLPSWSGLIEELAIFLKKSGLNDSPVRCELDRGDLLQAASFGLDQLTKPQVAAFFRSACRVTSAEPHEIHRLLVSLGPRCFITTNYDDLMEKALRKWQSERYYKVATNRHLTETADIVHARAIDFLYKPHGDVHDSESIVLSREQYRDLLPQGERHSALEALKTLLVSRPIVYIGFGLRDPDFIYLKDLLANTYRGAARDHYAIMPDVDEYQAGYWRRNYGIHIISYSSLPGTTADAIHAPLLQILQSATRPALEPMGGPIFDAMSATTLLALARHAAALESSAVKEEPELSIRVIAESKGLRSRDFPAAFNYAPVEALLDKIGGRSLLIGLPGAGKSYALRHAAARLAAKLHADTLANEPDVGCVVVPIFVDLKLYAGSLHSLVSASLPSSLLFDEIYASFKLRIYADSFNEMPREYRENSSYEQDFSDFIERFAKAVIVIGSRTTDGLEKFAFPVFLLDEIDESTVSEHLQSAGVAVGGRFEREVVALLQKPFFFQLVFRGLVTLPEEPHPRDIYSSLLANIQADFERRFQLAFDLETLLAHVAFDAIHRGEEAYPLADILSAFTAQLRPSTNAAVVAKEMANWLVSKEMLVPYSGGRVAFIHQSVTEYLAAKELARRYVADPRVLRESLALTRWDQALFLALSLLPSEEAGDFFSSVVSADFELALTAVKYVEVNRDELVSKLLAQVPEFVKNTAYSDIRIEWIISRSLPVAEVHVDLLRKIMSIGDMIGGAAAQKLIDVGGGRFKGEVFNALVERVDDFNFGVNGAGPALSEVATLADVDLVLQTIDRLKIPEHFNEEEYSGFVGGIGRMLSRLDQCQLRDALLPESLNSPAALMRAHILSDSIWMDDSQEALNTALDLWELGLPGSVATLSLLLRPSRELSLDGFHEAHVTKLCELVASDAGDEGSWAISVLRVLCTKNPSFSVLVSRIADTQSRLRYAALLDASGSHDYERIEKALWEVVEGGAQALAAEPVDLARELSLPWSGRERLFVALCRLGNSKLLYHLTDAVDFNELRRSDETIQLDIGEIEFWLEWIFSDRDTMLADRFGVWFSRYLPKGKQDEFVTEFNKPVTRYRHVLAHKVLVRGQEVSTDDFSRDAVSFLLAELGLEVWPYRYQGSLLGNCSTELFVTEHLLPLLYDDAEPVRRNVKKVLREAGRRHGRRYLFDSPDECPKE